MARSKDNSLGSLSNAELAQRAQAARLERERLAAEAQRAKQEAVNASDPATFTAAAQRYEDFQAQQAHSSGEAGAAQAELNRRARRAQQEAKQITSAVSGRHARRSPTIQRAAAALQAELSRSESVPSSSQNGRKPDAQPTVPNVSPVNQNGRRPNRQVRERTSEEEAALLQGVAHAVTGLYAHDVRRVPKRGESVSAEEAERFAQIADGARGQLPPMRDGRPHGNEHAGRALAGRAGRMVDHVTAGTATPDEQQTYNDVKALAEQSGRDIRRPQAAKHFVGSRLYNLFNQASAAQKRRS